MRTIGMLDGNTFINEHPVYLENETPIYSNFDGILYSNVHKGQFITKGAHVAYTTDYWGNVLEKYYAPLTGIVVVIKVSPVINKGEMVFKVAEAVDHFKE